jgi:hypothetical protein
MYHSSSAVALAFMLLVANATGCAASVESAVDVDADAAEAELSNAPDLKLFRDALAGISSSGSEGDPVAYRAVIVRLQAGDTWNADTLANRIGAKIPQLRTRRQPGASYGYQGFVTGTAMNAYWSKETTADPNAEDPVSAKVRAVRMKALKALCAQKLTNVTHMVVGVLGVATDPASIETGAVAPLIVGKLANGRLIVLYGIDIWT